MTAPSVHELSPPPEPFAALAAVSSWPQPVLLESARRDGPRSRYSFLTADPLWSLTRQQADYGEDPFGEVRARLAAMTAPAIEGLPPFQGGAVGLLSYELGGCWERLPAPPHNEFAIPACTLRIYDWVLAWDHEEDRAWIIAHSLGGEPPAARIEVVLERLRNAEAAPSSLPAAQSDPLTIDIRQHPLTEGWTSNFSRDQYLAAVEQVIEYIRAGDIFQANLSQRLLAPTRETPLTLYGRLRQQNPAPFAAYFAHEDWAVLSASPERFLQLAGDVVSTRPIKGTRSRRTFPEADLLTRDELRESEKDRAENVMIVDLLRNDLSRVCRAGSIRVPELCTVETYETVQHLVSEVRGQLAEGRDFWDLLAATFPGGSITGAPKVRAMEIITELEQIARGAYCGSLFYLGFDGTADSSILIRTLTHRGGWVSCPVGGGIVAQSDPAAEYEETLHKAAGMLRVL
jgi:para-aminobenzoate synthetase component I